MANSTVTAPPVKITAEQGAAEAEILTPQALDFLASLAANFEAERQNLLAARAARGQALRQGQLYDFLPETASVRAGDWRVAPIPADIQDRRKEECYKLGVVLFLEKPLSAPKLTQILGVLAQ